MDLKKFGKFLAELRKEKNLTQEELSKIVNMDRSVISKWERGVYLPGIDVMKQLSKFYGISINEMLYAERINDENRQSINDISLTIANDSNTKKKKYKISIIIVIFISIFLFLFVYFLSNYNSIKIYSVSGSNENLIIKNAIFVVSKHRTYLKLGDITTIQNEDIDYNYFDLYVLNNTDRIDIIKRTDNSLVKSIEKIDDYLTYDNQDAYLDNLYMDIHTDDTVETIKLNSSLEMTNNKVINISDDETTDILSSKDLDLQNGNANDFIKNNFIYDMNKQLYTYKTKIDNNKVYFEYDDKINCLNIYLNYNSKNIKYYFDLNSQTLILYICNSDNQYNIVMNYLMLHNSCSFGNCSKYKKYIKYFKEKFYELITS